MNISISHQPQPNQTELEDFFEAVFSEIPDTDNFTDDQDQNLAEWFSLAEMLKYVAYGKLIEARLENHQLVGAIFIGMQNPITWPDGKKMEIFILGVDKNFRGNDISKKLMMAAEAYALEVGAQKIIVNTHVAMESVHAIYQKFGYEKIGVLKNYYDNGDAAFFQKILNQLTTG